MEHLRNSGGWSYSQQDDQLRRDYNELDVINHRQEKRVHHYVNRAQNLTIGYLAVLGIYMIPISHYRSSSTSYCRNWWVPFSISLSTAVIYFITFLDVVKKFYWTQYYLEVNRIDQQNLQSRIREAKDESKSHKKVQVLCHQGEPDPLLLFKRKLYIYFTISALIAISLLELYACRLFSC
ncbi:hypothetical protein I3843_05G232000 [Carya illinoinensis]|uniref:Uncharacterized protein n=1 Tax=Carya illinoinensis TaxID=32201 RepID=A0A8T1QNJ1_CARIL|nr:hypothetical protein I3760_05G256100 [Carya illinoinensis]KAG6656047.1 hypothetical protein CIPAW_05G259800 [Carya illinoinensis]KAG7981400.1 hypothetical protein I3843_05G232000 [Carya illinoinensis]